jgi:hypothetical protein
MRAYLLPVTAFMLLHSMLNAQSQVHTLPVHGRVTNGDAKLPGCLILVYKGNEVVAEQVTGKSGKFALGIPVGDQYALEFKIDGYVPKRIIVDTRADVPAEELVFAPLDMVVGMMAASKYAGADTDALDMPFAIVRFNPKTKAFEDDLEYTRGMMRTNGSLLLMAGRAGKD